MEKTNAEKSDAGRSDRLAPGDPNDPESYKVRKGVVGGHTAYLATAQVRTIDAWLSHNLSDFFSTYRYGTAAVRRATQVKVC